LYALQQDSPKAHHLLDIHAALQSKTPIGQQVSIHVSRSAQINAQILLVAAWLSQLPPRSSGALHYKVQTPKIHMTTLVAFQQHQHTVLSAFQRPGYTQLHVDHSEFQLT